MVTYNDQSPSEIRVGDDVTDALGRNFTALSDAVFVAGDYSVQAMFVGDKKWLTLDYDSKVSITYNEWDWQPVEEERDGSSYSS